MSQKTEIKNFPIVGMHCASCAALVEKKLEKVKGVKDADVNYGSEQATLIIDKEIVKDADLEKAVEEAGYKAVITKEEKTEEIKNEYKEKEIRELKVKLIVSLFLSTLILFGSFPQWFPFFPEVSPIFFLILTTIVQFWGGEIFYRIAWSNLKNRTTSMETLIAIGTSAAYFYSSFSILTPGIFKVFNIPAVMYFDTSAVIITLILLGRYLEIRAKVHTSDAIKKLIGLQAKTARVIHGKEEIEVEISKVELGDLIKVKPGEKIPVDGIISRGSTSINESMVTGESIPIEKGEGDSVIGSTININGSIIIKATKIGKDTFLSRIVAMVARAQSSKPEIQKLADKVSSYFVPVILLLSLFTFIYWLMAGNFGFAVSASIAVLVVACPCALGLATPTAIMVGVGKAAEEGILIKDAQNLESAYKIKTIIFDKTGTLTEGKPIITDIVRISRSKLKDRNILGIAASIEQNSEHPLANSVVNEAKERHLELTEPDYFKAHPGYGIEGNISGKKYYFGNRSLMDRENIGIENRINEEIKKLESEGKTVMLLSDNNRLLGLIAVADTLKPNVKKVIERLMRKKINVWMVTGDNERVSRAISQKAGIKNVLANVLPQGKAEKVKELKNEITAFVGDGINDAPALASADVGIAMGSGTDVAIETAGITILGKDLGKVLSSITLSRKTIDTIKQNLFWAFGYNILLIPVASGILGISLKPEFAAFAMAASSLSVVGNSLRLKKVKIN